MLLRLTLLLSLALPFVACGDGGDGDLGTPVARDGAGDATSVPDETLPPVIAAREDLAARLGQAPEEVAVVSVTRRQWADACLGLARPNERCAQVITPGYEVVLMLDGNSYTYRTDQSTHVRFVDESAGSD